MGIRVMPGMWAFVILPLLAHVDQQDIFIGPDIGRLWLGADIQRQAGGVAQNGRFGSFGAATGGQNKGQAQ